MIETFTSNISSNLANDTTLYEETSLNAEDKIFYAMLQQPLDNLLKEPSQESLQSIFSFSRKCKTSNC